VYAAEELHVVFGPVLRRLSATLEASGQPWMLIGGLALGAWTEVRGTKDCDFAVALPADYTGFDMALQRAGFSPAKGGIAEAAAEGGVVRLRSAAPGESPVFVDLLCAGTEFERSALSRRRRLEVLKERIPLYVVSPDDLAVYKLIAGRPLIRFKRVPEDEAYLRRWAREWGVEDRLDAALRSAAR